MAFRELSQNELELLTDSQREVYEKKLEVYRERARFVEQLEKMENVHIEAFTPVLNPIKQISGAPEKTFLKQEKPQMRRFPIVAVQLPEAKPVSKEPVKVQVKPTSILTAPAVKAVSKEPVRVQKKPAPVLTAPVVKAVGKEPVRVQKTPVSVLTAPVVKAVSKEPVKVQKTPVSVLTAPVVKPVSSEPVKARIRLVASVTAPVKKTTAMESVKAEITDPIQPVNVPNRIFAGLSVPSVQVAYPASLHTPKIRFPQKEIAWQPMPIAAGVAIPEPRVDEVLRMLRLKDK